MLLYFCFMTIFLFKAHRDTLYSALYKYLFIIIVISKQIWIERAIFNDSEAKYTKWLLMCKKKKKVIWNNGDFNHNITHNVWTTIFV